MENAWERASLPRLQQFLLSGKAESNLKEQVNAKEYMQELKELMKTYRETLEELMGDSILEKEILSEIQDYLCTAKEYHFLTGLATGVKLQREIEQLLS